MTNRRQRLPLWIAGLTATLLVLTLLLSLRLVAHAETTVPPSEPVAMIGAPTPEPGTHFVAVSSGDFHTCALRATGEVVCWGASESGEQKGGHGPVDFGQASPPPDKRLVDISSGYDHTCGLRSDGTPVCWGASSPAVDRGQTSPPPGERFVALSSGSNFTCGLRADGSHACWRFTPSERSTEPGVPGVHTYSGSQVPKDISSHGYDTVKNWVFAYVSNGNRFTCALDPDGAPVCWGIDDYGQASPPDGERFNSPQQRRTPRLRASSRRHARLLGRPRTGTHRTA